MAEWPIRHSRCGRLKVRLTEGSIAGSFDSGIGIQMKRGKEHYSFISLRRAKVEFLREKYVFLREF